MTDIAKLIERLMAFHQLRQIAIEDLAADAVAMARLRTEIDELTELLNPGVATDIVLHYEKEIAKLQAETTRNTIIRQAVREVMMEEADFLRNPSSK